MTERYNSKRLWKFGDFRSVLLLAGLVWALGPSASIALGQSYLQSIGVPPFSTSLAVENGSINLANGNLHLAIPLGSFPQRGGQVDNVVLMYDSAIWHDIPGSGTWTHDNVSLANSDGDSLGGWRLVTSGDKGFISFGESYTGTCYSDSLTHIRYPFIWFAPDGTQHSFPIQTEQRLWPSLCPSGPDTPNGVSASTDGLGYIMYVDSYTETTVYGPDGRLVHSDCACNSPYDTNGNVYTPGTNVTDFLGRTPVTTTTSGNTIYYDVLNAQGSTSTYTVAKETIDVHTNFGYDDTSTTIDVIQSISLPDGTSYSFTYDSGSGAGHYGTLHTMTLPTGGTITYAFNTFSDAYGNDALWITDRTTPEGHWTYAPVVIGSNCTSTEVNCQQTVTVAKPTGSTTHDDSVYTFTLNGGAWPTQVQYYTGTSSGTLLATTSQCFDFVTVTTSGTCTYGKTSASPATNVHLAARTTTLPVPGTNISATTKYFYDEFSNITEVAEWNFGSSPTGTADRTTTTTYAALDWNILDHPASVTVTNSSSGTVAKTLYSYDENPPTSPTGIVHHDDGPYGPGGSAARGNLTKVQRLVSGDSNYLTTSMTYDLTGEVLTSTDSKGNQTSFSHIECFYDDTGSGHSSHSASNINAFTSSITAPLSSGSNSQCHYWGTSQLASVTDANGQTTQFHFFDGSSAPQFSRPSSILLPNGGWTLNHYNVPGSIETGMDTYTGIADTSPSTSCSSCRQDEVIFDADGLGRVGNAKVVNDPDGATQVDTNYDTNGRVYNVSNPYRSTSESTYGVDTPSYDGIDRIVEVTHDDPAHTITTHAFTYFGSDVGSNGGRSTKLCSGAGYPVLTVDEGGKKRQQWTDAFGRLIEVDEPTATGSLDQATCYQYDLNNNLTYVSQNGSRIRTYQYDLLSRLTSRTDPESGTTYFYYTTAGGAPCSGDPSAICRRVAPAPNQNGIATITTMYSYDALNRLTQISYSDATPTITYSYDSPNCLGLSACYNLGRRTGMTDGSGTSSWAYDAVGNILRGSETIAGVTKTVSYTYNGDSSLATILYPSGRTLTYTPGNAQRATALTDTTDTSHPINYASSAHYAPHGALSSLLNGPSNILSSWSYNSRLQSCRMAVNTSGTAPNSCSDSSHSGNVMDLAYTFGSSNNGNVNKISDKRTSMSGRSVNYAYDLLNRIKEAYTDATSGSYCWAENFNIDAFGNLTGIGGKSDHSSCTQENLNLVATSKNRLSTDWGSDYIYDAAGNLTTTPFPFSANYSYNAENQMVQSSDYWTLGYLYDGLGRRVAKTYGGTPYQIYWYGMNDVPLAETDGSGNILSEYIFFAGKRIAQRVVSGQ